MVDIDYNFFIEHPIALVLVIVRVLPANKSLTDCSTKRLVTFFGFRELSSIAPI